MYVAKLSASVNSVESPALVYKLIKGEQIAEIDKPTLLNLLRLGVIEKVADFKTATELKNNG